jgi:hypothetical protein
MRTFTSKNMPGENIYSFKSSPRVLLNLAESQISSTTATIAPRDLQDRGIDAPGAVTFYPSARDIVDTWRDCGS